MSGLEHFHYTACSPCCTRQDDGTFSIRSTLLVLSAYYQDLLPLERFQGFFSLISVFLCNFPTGLGGFSLTAFPRQLFVNSSFGEKYKGSGKDLSMLRLLPSMI